MRRWTLNFSMYSDMSMRTRERSSSNRHSARAFASSVLPHAGGAQEEATDGAVGVETGQHGTTHGHRLTASSWPTTRLCSSSSGS